MRTFKGILIATLVLTLFISSATTTLAQEEPNIDDSSSIGTFNIQHPGVSGNGWDLVGEYTSSSLAYDIGDELASELPIFLGGYGGFLLSQAAKRAITKYASTYAGAYLGNKVSADVSGNDRVYYRTYKYISVGTYVSVAYKVMAYSDSSRNNLIDSYWEVRFNIA